MKVSFIANMPSFITPIAEHISKHDDLDVNMFVNGPDQILTGVLQSSDVLWFEWCNEMLIKAQKMSPLKTSKVICRMHSYEAFTDMPMHVDWSKVDKLILVNESVKRVLDMRGMLKHIQDNVEIEVINNPVDCTKYELVDIAEKKGNKVAFLGHINYKKDPSMLIPIAEHLDQFYADAKDRFKIYVAGEFQDLRYALIFDQWKKHGNYERSIVFEGFQENVGAWLKDKTWMINTSLFESFNYALAEGMLAGVIPLARQWMGIENVYPHIKTWSSIEQIDELIMEFEDLSLDEMRKMQKYNRQFIIDNYSFDVIMPKIEKVLEL